MSLRGQAEGFIGCNMPDTETDESRKEKKFGFCVSYKPVDDTQSGLSIVRDTQTQVGCYGGGGTGFIF